MVKSRIEFIFNYYIEEGNGHLLADGWELKTASEESKSIHMSERYYYPCPTSICLCYISPQFLLLREDFVLILWLLYCLFQSLKTHLFLTHRWIEREGRGRKGELHVYMTTLYTLAAQEPYKTSFYKAHLLNSSIKHIYNKSQGFPTMLSTLIC